MPPAAASVFFLSQCCAQLTARRQGVVIRRLIANYAVADKVGSVIAAAFLPAAHPFSVTPAIGAKQGDVLSAQASLAAGEHRFKFALLQLFLSLIHI